MDYVDTHYRRTLHENAWRDVLGASLQADVCIVGAGLAGLTAALTLARAGQQVVVLEARRVAWGASGRNGGFVSPGFSANGSIMRRLAGAATAKELHNLSIEGMELVRQNIEALGIESAVPTTGITRVARYEAAADLQEEVETAQREYGYELSYLDRQAVQSILHTPRYYQGLRDPRAFHFHPLNYARALADEIERLGGRIFEDSEVVSVETGGPSKTVRTARGSVSAKDLVFTTGGYTTKLLPRLRSSFLPIATYVLLTEQAPELIKTAIQTSDAIGDDRKAGDYYRLVDGGRRILWGGRITTRRSEPGNVAALLRRTMVSTFPQLRSLEIETAWSGLMSYARHSMPQIGQLQPHVWHCTAFGGHGTNTTAIGGTVVAEAILGQSDRIKLFEPFGLVWNGGPFGRIAVQAIYWKLQAGDWLRERRA